MVHGRRPLRRRGVETSERGATIVEFAIVSVAFFGLVLGTIDFSMAMFEMNGVNFGTRSQARSASNGEWGDSLTCKLNPPPSDPDIRDLMCATKQKTSVASDRVAVKVRFEDPDDPTRPNVKPQKGKSLVLCTMATIRSVSGVFGPLVKDKVITSIARSRIERDLSVEWTVTGSTVSKGPLAAEVSSEAPLNDTADWKFCDAAPVGNEDVGTLALEVDPLKAKCDVTWTTSGQRTPDNSPYEPGDDAKSYILDGDVTNLSPDPWNAYEIEFNLPVGHVPQLLSNRAQEGRILAGPPVHDEFANKDTWTFRKIGSDYGLPLEDGDLQPGNGVSVSVDVAQGADVVKTVPSSGFAAAVRVPEANAPTPLSLTNPFGASGTDACKADNETGP
jgi:hypothetical protein